MTDLPDRDEFWDDDHVGTVIDAWLNGDLKSRDEMNITAAIGVFDAECVCQYQDFHDQPVHKLLDAAWGL